MLAAVALSVTTQDARATPTAHRRQMTRAVREVSHYLGNTPAVCRASYIDPRVFELFEQGRTVGPGPLTPATRYRPLRSTLYA